ncbi:MAG: SocA family protein [Acidobacteria bacterium]|nr:SocA family protein [Acidobacteriota bacterium]
MLACQNVANYFLSQVDEEAGDLISNLKLQKLVYYAQGFHLAMYDQPLFPEAIEAWGHGPVVPTLYQSFKAYGSQPLPCPVDLDFSIYSPETKELLDEVYSVYGQFSAWKLRNMTHEEPPWKNTKLSEVISHDSMRDYFKTLLVHA